jgi:hypothetical protein
MKILDVITEDRNWTKTAGKMRPDQIKTLPSAHLVSGTADRVYDLYRLGMKVAEADGIHPIKGSSESWVGRNNTVHPYTQHEADMMKDAYRANGVVWTDELAPNPRNKSLEPAGTHTVSPVASSAWKKGRSK